MHLTSQSDVHIIAALTLTVNQFATIEIFGF